MYIQLINIYVIYVINSKFYVHSAKLNSPKRQIYIISKYSYHQKKNFFESFKKLNAPSLLITQNYTIQV